MVFHNSNKQRDFRCMIRANHGMSKGYTDNFSEFLGNFKKILALSTEL